MQLSASSVDASALSWEEREQERRYLKSCLQNLGLLTFRPNVVFIARECCTYSTGSDHARVGANVSDALDLLKENVRCVLCFLYAV